jgi:hypothetical protein
MNCFKLLFAALLLTTGVAYSQSNAVDTVTASANLKKSGADMAKLFTEKDYAHYIKYINPKVIETVGGNDSMIVLLNKTLIGLKEQGLTINSMSTGDPLRIIITSSGLQSVVPEILNLGVKDGRLEATSYLIAVSEDNGNTWTFIDTGGNTLDKLQTMFPTLSNDLVIPEKQQPKFIKE